MSITAVLNVFALCVRELTCEHVIGIRGSRRGFQTRSKSAFGICVLENRSYEVCDRREYTHIKILKHKI